ncbi:DNA topoisomerase [Mycolicibacterium phlei]|uniref:DNA topoisomerase (ATP-hydrolyzing) n=1 Tax=Mycolicibacterium phlei DSM 43239 = CCUG 21000 TaxID=1226750 RepID=A0A5N5US47_MYCPH|nr:toprim domain-containing protein [Mycolicibacterium phlei]VEG09445.1 DNA topoisomerase [Mycobacteroides chelonae]AMO61330.1 DNA gyrase subunit B-like protein [Mycolicibacterium phlei]EID14095.1 type IIA topoisomerase (DNA gyrase/topo II, topoisomerase IV), B subunit [Mycolicibacterium phlei RIVM601174]KAB7752434.1 DNA gyrase subunit B [Mycolicibacterium phlei DSM 43239 = CCUG 21000]KXW60782.1 DNA gyrase subunit B [Mycolicibacterium phlei DSM 43239 = CCUG 21000]
MSYTAADITELDDVQHTRLRPAVNLGLDILNTALREIIDNAIEEVAVPSHGGSTVTITLHTDGSVSVADDGRGLPVDTDPTTGKNGIVKTLGTARAGGKFSAHKDATSTGAGLNGIGAAAAVFISARTDVTVHRDGKTYRQSFGRGYPGEFEGDDFDPDAPFTRRDNQKLRGVSNRKPKLHGTTVRILFDKSVTPDSTLDIGEVLLRAHASARMSPGVQLVVVDEGWPGGEVPPSLLEPFNGPWGTDTLLDLMCNSAGTPAPEIRCVVEGRGEYTTGRGPTPFRWSLAAGPAEPATVAAFCNTVRTPGGGSHLTAAIKGLSEALADRASRIRDLGLAKGEEGPEPQDFAAVTALAVDTRAPDVSWDSQAKTAVSSRSLNLAMAPDVARSVTIWAANPANADTVTLWTKLALEYARARRSAEGAKARARAAAKAKGLGTNLSLPPKLLPSRETGRGSGAELFLCEGDSALGTIKAARDATFQAAFPLKGKPPNVYGFALSKARAKDEFDAIERILGCGVRENCDPELCRYDRILFASDADPDGGNINSSLISMFLDFYRPLVEAGMVYVTMPPLFVVKAGDERIYCQDESERDAAVAKLKETTKKRVEVQRNKGLGEMDADDFWNTVLDPQRRTVIRVRPDDSEKKLHHILFGGPPEGRRTWMAEVASRIDTTELDLT